MNRRRAAMRVRRAPGARDPRVERSLFSWWSYLVVLFLFAAAVTITFGLLFYGVALPQDEIIRRAPIALLNVFGVSAMVTVAWGLYRRQTTQKPVNRILAFTERMAAGDFDARIPERRGPLRNEFDVMIGDLNQMAAELGSVEALRTDFVASVSHEMKTPLSVMSNYATIMQNPALPEAERIAYARKTGAAARRLSDMVSNMLKLNKLDNQQIFPEPAAFDLSEQLAECILGIEDVLERGGLDLQADVEEGVVAWGDPELLALVWNNLLSNAVKFTEPGGRIAVSLARTGAGVRVTVSDTGCGIGAKDAAHVFDKFYQADTSRSGQGNGLGLALVKRVVDLHDGEVSVESRPGVGSSFSAFLPAGRDA